MKPFSKVVKIRTFIFTLSVIVVFILFFSQNHDFVNPAINDCYNENKKYVDEACFSKEIKNILANSPKDFELVFETMGKWIKKNNFDLAQCHFLEHEIGENLGEFYKTNLEQAFVLCENSKCSYGCVHGISIYVLDSKEDPDYSIEICKLVKDNLIRSQCYHGIGHAIIHVYGEDFDKATAICRKLGDKSQLCFDGVVHEIIIQKEYKFSTPEVLFEECKNITGERIRETCYLGVGFYLPYFKNRNFSLAAQECYSIQGDDKKFCIMGIGMSSYIIENLNLTISNEICKEISSGYSEQCINGILYGILYFGDARDLTQCEYFEEMFRDNCIKKLREYAE